MTERATPPDEIAPIDFFTQWVPQNVAADPNRARQLRTTQASLLFHLTGEGGGDFALELAGGVVAGRAGIPEAPDLVVTVSVDTWRALNRGEISAPEAVLKRKLHVKGDFLLALKLHLILG